MTTGFAYADAAGPIGSLAMSLVRPKSPILAVRARAWQRDLERLGVVLPFALVHDVGLLVSTPHDQLEIGRRCDVAALVAKVPGAAAALSEHRDAIEQIAAADGCIRASALRMNDAATSAVLARLLGPVASRVGARPAYASLLPTDGTAYDPPESELATMWARADRKLEMATLDALARTKLHVLTLLDALDVDTLRLVGVLGDPSTSAPLLEVDLLDALASPSAHDVVTFSLELLPSVLESKARPGAARYAAAGYAGVGKRGSLDSMVLTELAWDEDELLRRVADDEVLYYARDETPEELKRVHHLLVDASASMRGDRASFARGLALATAKKLVLLGEEVVFRFFDARLYDPIRARGRELPTAQVLAFRGERGRNPARVFATLAHDVALVRAREKRDVVVHLFTHGAFDVPRDAVAAVRAEARLSAVFIAPRGEVQLAYLDLLDAHWVVGGEALGKKTERSEAARAILGETRAGTSS